MEFRIEKTLAQLRRTLSDLLLKYDDAHLPSGSSSSSAAAAGGNFRQRLPPFLLHQYQWRCLLDAYQQFFRHIDDVLFEILEAPLQALLFALESAGRSLTECIAPHIYESVHRSPDITASSDVNTSDPDTRPASDGDGDDASMTADKKDDAEDLDLWMMQKALKHGLSGEVEHLHMDNLQTCAIAVLESLTNYYASAKDLDLANVIKKGKDVGGGCATMTTQVEQQQPNVEDLDLDRALDRDLASAQSFFGQQFCSRRTCEIAKLVLDRISLCSHTDPNTTTVMKRLKVAPAQFSDVIEKDRIKVIGEGGFGKVIEKKWMLESHVVAVKEVKVYTDASSSHQTDASTSHQTDASSPHQTDASSPHQKQLPVYDEAATQARLYHPNLLPLLCVTEEDLEDLEEEDADHIVGLVMERMLCNLEFLIKKRKEKEKRKVPFPLHVSVDIMMQIAIGMEYLHRNGIIHRDLKPGNILISPDSVGLYDDDNRLFVGVKIADFGLSKALASNYSSSSPQVLSKSNVGTSVWRAPEVIRLDLGYSDDLTYNNKVDVYSFAMVCYQLMTGRVPFEGEASRWISLYRKIHNKNYRPTFNEHDYSACPAALIDMIQCCWRTDPSQRPRFTQIASFLRYVKACAVPMVGSIARGENYEVGKWKKELVQRKKLFSEFHSNERSGLKRMNSIEMCMEMRRMIMEEAAAGGERSSNAAAAAASDSAKTTTTTTSSNVNGKIFGVYIGAYWNGVTLNNIPINNSGAEVHVFLSFAIDYTSDDGSSANNGKFLAFWDTSRITADAIKAFKASYSNVKIIISLGGATVADKPVQFKPTTVSSWVTNAVSTLTTLIHTYHADGIDFYYLNFDNTTASDFASAAGQLITKLKQANVITIASIAPFTHTQAPYVALWNAYSSVIDYVNYKFFELGRGTTVAQYVTRYNTVKSTYSGAKVLSSLITEKGSNLVSPSVAIQASQQLLHDSGGLPGIFIWSADDSYADDSGFTYEEQAQAIVAS